jgi:hypothetical protein
MARQTVDIPALRESHQLSVRVAMTNTSATITIAITTLIQKWLIACGWSND